MAKNIAAPVTADTVRTFYRADEKRMARLSPEAQATVRPGARGKIHRQAVKGFNGNRPEHRRYLVGATSAVKAQRLADRAALQDAGLAGKSGRLSSDAKEWLAQNKR